MNKKLILYTILIYLICNAIAVLLLTGFNLEIKIKSTHVLILKYGKFFSFFLFVFLSPFIEECIFRFPLIKTKIRIYFSFLLGIFFFYNNVYLLDFEKKELAFSLFIIAMLFFIIWLISKYTVFFNAKNINKIGLISAILFGAYHFKMIDNINYYNISTYVYLTPKIILGLLLNKIRLRMGMKYSIVTHSLINLIGSISLLF